MEKEAEEKAAKVIQQLDRISRETSTGTVNTALGELTFALLRKGIPITAEVLEKELAGEIAKTRKGQNPDTKYDPEFNRLEAALLAVQKTQGSGQ